MTPTPITGNEAAAPLRRSVRNKTSADPKPVEDQPEEKSSTLRNGKKKTIQAKAGPVKRKKANKGTTETIIRPTRSRKLPVEVPPKESTKTFIQPTFKILGYIRLNYFREVRYFHIIA